MKALADFAKDALELPADKRLTLARILLELSDEREHENPAGCDVESDEVIVARMESVRDGRALASDLEEVMARLESRLP